MGSKKPLKSGNARTDALIIAAVVVAVWSFVAQWEPLTLVSKLFGDLESYNLREAMRGLILAGIGSMVFALRRHADFRREALGRGNAEDEIVWLTQHDPLTRLPNRQCLQSKAEQLEASISQHPTKLYAVLALDLDGFKAVNDLVGHAGGDELLVQVGDRLKWLLSEHQVFRLGGDEFAALLSVTHKQDALQIAQKTTKALEKPFEIKGIQVEIGASIGIAMMPEHTTSLDRALEFSDLAMYKAKKQSKGTCQMFTQGMGAEIVERSRIELELRRAIGGDQICVHYQPYIDLNTGEILGFEALARRRQADGTMIPPSIFIGIAEQSGQIIELSESLFKKACLAACDWPDDKTLSFNLSPSQLRDRLLSARIIGMLSECGLPPHRLELEVTESCFVHDHETVIATLVDLKNAGIRIALDDFGTGYSSFSRLTKIEFDKIKIDQLFVQECGESERMAKIVGAIFALGKNLETTIVAEGIETTAQLEAMKAFGCDIGQGYLFGRPEAEDVTVDLIAAINSLADKKRIVPPVGRLQAS